MILDIRAKQMQIRLMCLMQNIFRFLIKLIKINTLLSIFKKIVWIKLYLDVIKHQALALYALLLQTANKFKD